MARFFRVDPLVLLDRNYQDWLITVAAFEEAVEQQNKAYEKAKNKQ